MARVDADRDLSPQLQVTICGSDTACNGGAPMLSTCATKRRVSAVVDETVRVKTEPEPACATIAPVVASMMENVYGVGPRSWLAVAVSVTLPPTAALFAVAARVIA